MPRRALLAAIVILAAGRAAHAEIGWEVEWDVELTQVEGDGLTAPAEGTVFYIKKTLGREGNWLITSDDVWDAVQCPPEILALFPSATTQGIQAYTRKDELRANPKAGKCFKGIIEFKSDTPLVNQAGIQTDMTALRTLIQRWLGDATVATVARTGGAPPLPGIAHAAGPAGNGNGGCNNTFPCVLRFPVYDTADDAINQVNAVPGRWWYVVIRSATVSLRPQVNLNVPLSYFAAPSTTNAFVNAQFQDLWATTAGATPWTFTPILAHTATPDKLGFYRLYGYYARKMDELAQAKSDLVYMMTKVRIPVTAKLEANKNKLNPNTKFDMCELRTALGGASTYLPLRSYFGSSGSIYRVKNGTPRQVLEFWTPDHCRFTTKDVSLRPFFSAPIRPLFEFRHPGANEACFDLITWIATGTGNLAALSQQCDLDSSVF